MLRGRIRRRLAELVPEAEAPVRARPEREATWQEFECADRQTTSLLEELQAARGSGFRARRRLRRAKREAEGRLYVALRSLEDTR